jgi:hypothetical protein
MSQHGRIQTAAVTGIMNHTANIPGIAWTVYLRRLLKLLQAIENEEPDTYLVWNPMFLRDSLGLIDEGISEPVKISTAVARASICVRGKARHAKFTLLPGSARYSLDTNGLPLT